MNIIMNTNNFEKVQANGYGKTLVKHTLEDSKTQFEAALRQLKKRGNTMRGTAYHQENLLQAGTTHYILG